MKKPLVYIASPYTMGDVGVNLRSVADVFAELMCEGECVPYSPIVATHLHHLMIPQSYNAWLEHCFDFIPHCDAMLRVNAVHYGFVDYIQEESEGADREVELAKELGIPVFYEIESLGHWLEAQNEDV